MSSSPTLIEQARSSDADVRQKAAQQVVRSAGSVDLPLMFELLGDRDWRVRKTIVDGFVQRPEPEVIEGLLGALYDPSNAGKRNSATEALIRIGEAAIEPIIVLLEREADLDVRLSLVNLLGDLRDERGYSRLLALLDSEEDLNILSSAVASIGRFRDPAAIPRLVALLERDDLWLKFHVIEALGEIGDRSALPAILPLYREKSLRKPVLEAAGRIGDVGTLGFLLRILAEEEKLNLTALRALIQVAEADKPRIIEQTERDLIRRKFRESFPPKRIPALIDHLRTSPKADVRNFILKVLGWTGRSEAIAPLMEALLDPESAEVAGQALIDFGPAAVPHVVEKLQSTEEDEVTALLLRVLNVIGGRETVGVVIGFLDHPNGAIRRLAIETLGEVPEPASIDYLLAKFDDRDVACQQVAVNAISALAAAFPEIQGQLLTKLRKLLKSNSLATRLNSLSVYVNVQGEGYHEELLSASKDSDPEIRQKAITLMGKFSDQRFAGPLVLSLADESTPVRLAAIESIAKLRPDETLQPLMFALEDDDIWIRTAAAQALGEYRDPAALEPLTRHLDTDIPPVKVAVIEALGKFEDERVREPLFECLGHPDVEVRRASLLALGRVPGDAVFGKLRHALADDDWRIRAAGALALGNRRDRQALPLLHEILERDPDPYVQQSAIEALERLHDPSSFPHLLRAIDRKAILDEVTDVLIRHRDVYRSQLEEAWRTADSRREPVIAAILQAMKQQ